MSQKILYIYVIHAKHLTLRANRFQNVLRVIDEIARTKDYIIKTQFIGQHEQSEIQSKLTELNTLISYDPIGDPNFDNQRYILTVPIMSNIEKHKEAWKQIQNMPHSDSNIYLILEDDAILLPENIQNLNDLFTLSHSEWDMLSLGLIGVTPNNSVANFINFRDTPNKILSSKESYCLKPATAALFLKQYVKYKFTLRLQLSYFIKTNPLLKIYFNKKPLFIDGSKLGIFPSSIHPTNLLIFNNEFIQMHNYVKKSVEDIKKNLTKIENLYKILQNVNSPDAMHLYGVILNKIGHTDHAEKIFMSGVEELKKQQGFINNQSEIVNNLIDLFKNKQQDINPDNNNAKYSVNTLQSLLIED
jgi:hypothetical protein